MITRSPLATIVFELDRAGIPHMLAGSFASSYHGDPRTTNDIDLVIDPTLETLLVFVRSLDPADYYASEEAAREAFERRGQFNVVLLDSGWKADLILCKRRDFSRSEFERRQRVSIEGTEVFVATAEDTVIAKLEWASAGQSERQLRDVRGILDVRSETLDRGYIESWVRALGLEPEWREVRGDRE